MPVVEQAVMPIVAETANRLRIFRLIFGPFCSSFNNSELVLERMHVMAENAAVETLVTDKFETTVADNDIVVIDYWAPWCGPCKGFAPVFEQVASENPDIKFVKVNTDEEQALAGHFQIRSIPTLMIFRENIIVFEQAGALPKGALQDVISQVRGLDMAEVKRGSVDRNEPQE
jgi:thioredoxin 1